jgi:hypothetical protein
VLRSAGVCDDGRANHRICHAVFWGRGGFGRDRGFLDARIAGPPCSSRGAKWRGNPGGCCSGLGEGVKCVTRRRIHGRARCTGRP